MEGDGRGGDRGSLTVRRAGSTASSRACVFLDVDACVRHIVGLEVGAEVWNAGA